MDQDDHRETGFGVDEDTTMRQRKPTEKGEEYQKDRIKEHTNKLSKLSENIETELETFTQCHNETELHTIKERLLVLRQEYIKQLSAIKTIFDNYPSTFRQSSFEILECAITDRMDPVLEKIDTLIYDFNQNPTTYDEIKPVKSVKSCKSSRSNGSVLSITAQKAKVESAKIKLQYAFRESEFRKRQAEVEKTNLELSVQRDLLEVERDLAMAEAEYKVFVEYEEDVVSAISNTSLRETKLNRTTAYVKDSGAFQDKSKLSPVAPVYYPINVPTRNPMPKMNNPVFHEQPTNVPTRNQMPKMNNPVFHEQPTNVPTRNQMPKINNPVFHEQFMFSPPTNEQKGAQFQAHGFAAEFSKYLIKKELLMTRFMNFNDQPESFPVWKESFNAITSELGVDYREYLDLLIKFLGPKSSEQAKSLRNANARMPDVAISRIWERLEERYGRPEFIDHAFRRKINKFEKIEKGKDFPRLYELADILNEIEAMKEDERYKALLGQYDTHIGVNMILSKLPIHVQHKWFDKASRYKRLENVPFPPFTEFTKFVRDLCTRCNDPGLNLYQPGSAYQPGTTRQNQNQLTVFKSELNNNNTCALHGPGHALNECRAFQRKSLEDRKQILKDSHICYKCCEASDHSFRNCRSQVKCKECDSCSHATAMHPAKTVKQSGLANQGGEKHRGDNSPISTKCTNLCGEGFSGRSCAKTILVKVFPSDRPEMSVVTYAVHDDQSNKTLGSPILFDSLNINSEIRQYSLSSCAGNTKIHARHATNITVQSLDSSCTFKLPNVIECQVPSERSEIPSPEVANHYPHLQFLADNIPPLCSADIGLLIGRDIIEAHHVEQHIVGPKGSPFAQKLPLGWVIVGEVCLGRFHKPDTINTFKTYSAGGVRPTILNPCIQNLCVKEDMCPVYKEADIFKTTRLDEHVGLSQDDRQFLFIMEKKMTMDIDGHWKAPLPFRYPRQTLPNNRTMALKRALMLESSLRKNSKKQHHMLEFMQQIFESGAAEVAPELPFERECWYLPLFGVYHPRKPGKIRGVFDSSAEYKGHSLNKMLLSGPNLTNSLLGVLLRFRRDKVAIVSDIQQMFYSFFVDEDHRDFLRFFWWKNNDPNEKLIEYRMTVHVFGNTPSPAVASFGLRKSVLNADSDVKNFVEKDFYVDDGLTSRSTESEAVNLLRRAQESLNENGKLKLHKISSNVPNVLKSFPTEDLEKHLQTKNIFEDELPLQASLGLTWDLQKDVFTFNLNMPEKPATRRGILSAISSIFDPIGFLNPITIGGRMLVREITTSGVDWDQPLREDINSKWENWKLSLKTIDSLPFSRMFVLDSYSQADSLKFHVFADASEKAISAVAYVRAMYGQNVQVGFVMGKSKLSPQGSTTIPRLELCAAVLATNLSEAIMQHLDVSSEDFSYYSDSKIVLGYLNNRSRRFYTYVANRVQSILKFSLPSQWRFVPSEKNPADCATRGNMHVKDFKNSMWITGPYFLNKPISEETQSTTFSIIDETGDSELRPEIQVKATHISRTIPSRFEKFSTWKSLVRAFSFLRRSSRAYKERKPICSGGVEENFATENYLIQTVQQHAFEQDIHTLKENKPIHSNSSIRGFSPIIDKHNLLRVGGRLRHASVSYGQKHPIIIPRKSHLAYLLVNHYHNKVKHQGPLDDRC